MKTTKNLTSEHIVEIKARGIDYSDIPQFSQEQLSQFKPAHPEYFKINPIKIPVSIKIDADVLAWFKSGGKGYQTRINAILREAMLHSIEN